MRLFWMLWSFLSFVSVILCTLGYILPYWLKGSVLLTMYDLDWPFESVDLGPSRTHQPSYMGLFRRCVYPVYAETAGDDSTGSLLKGDSTATTVLGSIALPDGHTGAERPIPLIKWRTGCGHYRLVDVPHVAWKLGLGFLTLACVILAFVTIFILLVGFELSLLVHHLALFRFCQGGLLLSGFLTLSACALYPLGWKDNREVSQICGKHLGGFSLERCRLGWAYLLTLLGGFLTIFSAGLPSLYFRQFCITQLRNSNIIINNNKTNSNGKLGTQMMLVGRYAGADNKGDQQHLYTSSSYMAMANSLDESACLQSPVSSGYPTPHQFPLPQCIQWPSGTPMWTPCVLVPAKSQSEFSAETTGSFDCSSVRLEKRTPVVRRVTQGDETPGNT